MCERKSVIVTGASRGIGKAIAMKFAAAGYNVALLSRHHDEVEAAARCLRSAPEHVSERGMLLPIECDVGSEEAVVRAFSRIYQDFGRIDVLVNNAGINSRKTADDALEQALRGFDDEVKVNMRGPYVCSLVAKGFMASQPGHGGSIVNISSVKGKEPTTGPAYGATKAGVIKLTMDLAKAFAKHGIRVNCVAPGFIDTGMTAELPEAKKQAYRSMIPLERFGSAEEVANVVFFLASADASYITGATLDVNGGYLMV